MDYFIRREDAQDNLEQAIADDWEMDYAIDRLNEIPAADVAPVVRCKDCKWWVSEKAYCRIQDNYVMDDDDFCSNGAPKEVNNG